MGKKNVVFLGVGILIGAELDRYLIRHIIKSEKFATVAREQLIKRLDHAFGKENVEEVFGVVGRALCDYYGEENVRKFLESNKLKEAFKDSCYED